MDEAQIISGLRACSAAAHEALYDTYAGELYDYCSALLQDDAAAAAALRETLLHAAASTESMPAGCSLRAWLYALARGRCRAGGERMIEHPMPEDDPSARLLISVLGTLTARDREVLELTGRHGLSENELEPVLGLPPDRVESLVADARRRFDQAMADELDRTGPVAYPSLAGISEGEDALALLFRALPRATPPSGQRPRILDDLLIAGSTGTVPAAFAADAAAAADAPPTSEIPVPGHGRPRRKRGLLVGGVAVAVLVLVGGVVVGVTQIGGPSQKDDRTAAVPTDPAQPSVDPTTLSTRSPGTHSGTPGTSPTGTASSTPSDSSRKSGGGRTGGEHGRSASPRSSSPSVDGGGNPPGTSTRRPSPPSTNRPPTHKPDPTPTPTPTHSSSPTETPTTESVSPTA